MAENDLDSGQSAGTTPTTNSGSSAGNGVQQSSFDAAKLQSTLEALTHRLDEVDARSKSLQGDKDRGVKQTKKEVEELKRQVAEIERLKGTGLGLEDAIEEVSFRDDIRSLKDQLSKLSPASAQPAGNGASGADDVAKVVAELGLSETDAEVIELSRQNSGVKLVAELGKLAVRRASQPQSSPSGAPAVTGGRNPEFNRSALREEYIKEVQANRGNKAAIRATQAKFKAKGLDVENIGFGL